MINELFRKWFGLDPIHCESCEILRAQLDESSRERKDLLHRLLDKEKSEPPPVTQEELTPITPSFTPWRVRQQMLEAEDRKKKQLMDQKVKEIDELEKELQINTENAK